MSIILSRVYELGSSLNILSCNHYVDWASINENNMDIIEKGLQSFKNISTLWLLKIQCSDSSIVNSIYKEALSYIKGQESYPIWCSYLDYLIKINSESISSEFIVIF